MKLGTQLFINEYMVAEIQRKVTESKSFFGSRALEAVDLRHRSESVRSQDDAPGLGPALTWRTISKLLSVVQGRDVLF